MGTHTTAIPSVDVADTRCIIVITFNALTTAMRRTPRHNISRSPTQWDHPLLVSFAAETLGLRFASSHSLRPSQLRAAAVLAGVWRVALPPPLPLRSASNDTLTEIDSVFFRAVSAASRSARRFFRSSSATYLPPPARFHSCFRVSPEK